MLFDLCAEPDVLKEVKQKIDLGAVKFEVGFPLLSLCSFLVPLTDSLLCFLFTFSFAPFNCYDFLLSAHSF